MSDGRVCSEMAETGACDCAAQQLDEMRQSRDRAEAAAERPRASEARLLALLKRLEWAGSAEAEMSLFVHPRCATCGGDPGVGHRPGCELAAEIGRGG